MCAGPSCCWCSRACCPQGTLVPAPRPPCWGAWLSGRLRWGAEQGSPPGFGPSKRLSSSARRRPSPPPAPTVVQGKVEAWPTPAHSLRGPSTGGGRRGRALAGAERASQSGRGQRRTGSVRRGRASLSPFVFGVRPFGPIAGLWAEPWRQNRKVGWFFWTRRTSVWNMTAAETRCPGCPLDARTHRRRSPGSSATTASLPRRLHPVAAARTARWTQQQPPAGDRGETLSCGTRRSLGAAHGRVLVWAQARGGRRSSWGGRGTRVGRCSSLTGPAGPGPPPPEAMSSWEEPGRRRQWRRCG